MDDDLQRDDSEEPDDISPEPSDKDLSPDAAVALLRTLLGGAVEGADRVLERLEPDRSSLPPDDDVEAGRVRHALIGLLLDTYGVARRGVSTAGDVASFGWSLIEPLAGPLLDPVRKPTEALVDRWVRIGRTEERRGREAAREITRVPVDEVVAYLKDNPETEALVKRQAEALLEQLRDDPRVTSLVRTQGDEYVEHLRENPESVQELVQGQSVGMVNEILDVLREHAARADLHLERVVRTALHRRPRDRVPGPSPAVRALAGNPRLMDDD
jgi:hypothetical protein